MAYISLYRKYRSQTFEDVMGQDHVTKTLQNAIRMGRVAHAYLFCGTRGTGKTTTARLLAKALNCKDGPTPQPCNVCPACVSITEGAAMDIVELDAASHRSIRDVEEIRENVKFPPMELRYKVFIIDEAHQLSTDAKDAFLKTLEEPPPYTVFVLATTEPQSIPITIRSRCQQFDFRRGSLRDICLRLKYVVDSEGMKAEDAALDLVASNADGSWRDSLSLLEQVLSFTDEEITVDDVNTVLGTVNQDFLFRLADTLVDGDERGAFEAAAQVVESGKEIQTLLRSAAQHFRNLLFALVVKDPSDVAASADVAARLKEQATRLSRGSLLRAVEIFAQAERDARYSDHHRLLLELALLKIIEACRGVAPSPAQPQHVPPDPPIKQKPAPRQPEQPGAKPAPAPERAAVTPQQHLPEFDKIREKWSLVLQHVRSISVVAHAFLVNAQPSGLRDGALVLRFQGRGQMDLLETEKGTGVTKKKALLMALERVFGVPNAKIICEVAPQEDTTLVPLPEEAADLPNPFEVVGQETMNDVFELFPDSKIVDT